MFFDTSAMVGMAQLLNMMVTAQANPSREKEKEWVNNEAIMVMLD